MNAPVLSFVSADQIIGTTERTLAHGEMTVAITAVGSTIEAAHSAAFWVEYASKRGGGHASDVEALERHRDLLLEVLRRIDAGLAELATRPGRRA